MNTPSNSPLGTCPDTADLTSLLDDAPPAGTGVGLAAHIEHCPACQRRLDELAGRGAWLDSLSTLGGSGSPGGSAIAEPSLIAVMDDLRRRPHSSHSRAGDSDLAFLSPAEAPGYIGRLGPYDVIEVVGRGGMGIVLKARDPSLGRVVAIKVMAPALAASQTARKRFVREARAAAAISHENVVTIHAVDEAQGLPYLVMQFVAGRSLENRIRERGGPLSPDEVVRIGAQTASGLAAAHEQGVIHRDVKPANIMLEAGTGRVKLTDFGLAHAADEASVTATGQVSGTPSFMAPEQARGERVDARADLFSLGCVLYAACAGRPPFHAPTPLAALRAVCDDEPPPLREANPDVPPWLAELVHAMLRKDPSERPASAQEVAELLGQHVAPAGSSVLGAGPVPAAATAGHRRRRFPLLAGLGGAALLSLGVFAIAELAGVTRLTGLAGNTASRGSGAAPASSPVTQPGTPSTPAGPFLVVPASTDDTGGTRTFASFAEAVESAATGDTVELRTDERIATPRVDVGRKALRIRAGDGFRPTLAQAADGQAILTSGGPLVLEGLTFEGTALDNDPPARGDEPGECLVVVQGGGPVHVANCRFVARGSQEARFGCLRAADVAACEVRNTELHALQSMGLQWIDVPAAGGRLRLGNVIQSGRFGLVLGKDLPGRAEVTIEGSSFLLQTFVALWPGVEPPKELSVRLERSVVAASFVRLDISPARPDDRFAEVKWTDSRVIYDLLRRGGPFRGEGAPDDASDDGRPRDAVVEADVRYAGDFRRLQPIAEPPTPADFVLESIRLPGGRLAPRRLLDNAGATIELVGPGPAYEAFRQSSAYAAWRAETDDALHLPISR